MAKTDELKKAIESAMADFIEGVNTEMDEMPSGWMEDKPEEFQRMNNERIDAEVLADTVREILDNYTQKNIAQ